MSRRNLLAVALLVVFALPVGAEASPRDARPSIEGAELSDLGRKSVGRIRDRILPTPEGGKARAAGNGIPAGASGGTYRSNGMSIRVYVSSSYDPNDEENQSWADFFTGLPQASDASSMAVYFAPFGEVATLCGGDANACYSPYYQRMVLPGEPPLDGTELEEVAAHEFAHHIARRRNNDPWLASDYGPKRWATVQVVCYATRKGWLFPGNEGSQYALNPGEGWAEAYRVAAGGSPDLWNIVDEGFFPDEEAGSAALADAQSPWRGNGRVVYRGSFSRRGPRRQNIRLPVRLDGRVRLELRTSRGLDVDLALYDRKGRKRLGLARRGGTRESLGVNVCSAGGSTVLRLYRYSGAGRFNLTAGLPN